VHQQQQQRHQQKWCQQQQQEEEEERSSHGSIIGVGRSEGAKYFTLPLLLLLLPSRSPTYPSAQLIS
jgi:hypothetical protein